MSSLLLLGFIHLPPSAYSITIFGIHFTIQVYVSQIAAFFCGIIMLLGSYYLMLSKPESTPSKSWQHSWLPAFTALAIAETLLLVPSYQTSWWIVFFLGNFVLFLIITSEYRTLYLQEDDKHELTELWLKCSGSIVLLVLIAYWHSSINRLFLLLPLLGVSFVGYAHRMLGLQSRQESSLGDAFSAALAAIYTSSALFYWRLSSIAFSLMSVSFLYVFIYLISCLRDGVFAPKKAISAILLITLTWMIALWVF